VFDQYGLGELCAFISECENGSMHVSLDYGVIESVDTGGGHEIVATGLFNRATPLLRYRTGDLVEPSDRACPCGRELPLVGRIEGRVDDSIITPEGARVGPAALSLAFQSVPRLRAAQMIQDDPASIVILMETEPDFHAEDEELMVAGLRARLGSQVELNLERVGAIPRAPSGKQRLVVSSISRQTPPERGMVTEPEGP
jgi:phenylacetate-CoA ligase